MNLKDQSSTEKKQFIENIGMYFETLHLPRMAGRIMGWLLICVPACQTAGDIGETLEMSKASVSTMTRLLIQMGLVEKVSRIGERREFYAVRSQINSQILRSRMEEFSQLNNLTRQGLALMVAESPQDQQRLRNMEKMCSLVGRSLKMIISQVEEEERLGSASCLDPADYSVP